MLFLRRIPRLLRHHHTPNLPLLPANSFKSFELLSPFSSASQPPIGLKGPNVGTNSDKKKQQQQQVKKACTFRPACAFPVVEVSPGMAALIGRLLRDGYLKEDSFWMHGSVDPFRVRVYEHSVGFLKFAVEQFGQKHQEIAKWLSGKHVKEIALFGCPSTDRKTVYAAKRMRSFFKIPEETVCKDCQLRTICKFPNKRAGGKEKLILVDVLLVLIGYSLPNRSASQQHISSSTIRVSIDKILTDAVNLCNTVQKRKNVGDER